MIFGANHGSASDIEIMWTLIALFGICFSIYNIREAFQDVKAIEENRVGNGRRIIARSSRLAEATRLIKQLIFFTIGVIAMTLPPTPSTVHLSLRIEIFQNVITWGLIVAAILTSYQSYLTLRVRRQIRRGAYNRLTQSVKDVEHVIENGSAIKVEGTIQVTDE